MGYTILVANPSVREIEPLPWDIAIGVGGVVRSKPVERTAKKGSVSMRPFTRKSRGKKMTHQAWTKICLALSDALVVVAALTFAANFSRVWSVVVPMPIRPGPPAPGTGKLPNAPGTCMVW